MICICKSRDTEHCRPPVVELDLDYIIVYSCVYALRADCSKVLLYILHAQLQVPFLRFPDGQTLA